MIGTDHYVTTLNRWTKRIDDISFPACRDVKGGLLQLSRLWKTVYKSGITCLCQLTGGFSRHYMRMGDSPRVVSASWHSQRSNAVKPPPHCGVQLCCGSSCKGRNGHRRRRPGQELLHDLLGLLSDGRLDVVRSAVTWVSGSTVYGPWRHRTLYTCMTNLGQDMRLLLFLRRPKDRRHRPIVRN